MIGDASYAIPARASHVLGTAARRWTLCHTHPSSHIPRESLLFPSAMADYDIFREQLAINYPSHGHALWEPNPRKPDRPVQVGDVGFIRRGKFYRLFNALLPADDPSHEHGVPEYFEPLVPAWSDHLDTGFLVPSNHCSAGVSVESDPGYYSR